MLCLRWSVESQPGSLRLRHRLTSKSRLGDESRLFESTFGFLEPLESRLAPVPFGKLSGEGDDEPEPVLQVSELRLTQEPLPIQIRKSGQHPGQRLGDASVQRPFGERL